MAVACSARHEQDNWVTAINASYSTRCAEEDNVYLKLQGRDIQKFRIVASHPFYIESLMSDSSTPDFSGCSFDGGGNAQDPVFRFTPKRVVLGDSDELLVMGTTFERFWRSEVVEVSVNGVQQNNIHLIQVFLKDKQHPERASEEFLVLYPTDGYWRLKPLAASHLNTGAYGTSFLVGPIKEALRPTVDLLKVEFIPASRTFELDYRDGSHGTMKIVEINRQHAVLDYFVDRPSLASRPMVAMRSMYVAPDNADASQVVFQRRAEEGLSKEPLMEFDRAEVQNIRLGRSTPSKHNASSPDMWFGHFRKQ
ncbi:hypothetical protein C0J56_23575 [Pseudomonas fluorescens]|nr:hypothetical protein C0J56_23575 [Pseudomonas fluorescens]